MLKALIATSTFPLHGTHVPRFVFDLARSLGSSVDITVLAPGAPGAAPSEARDGVRIERFTYFLPRSWQRLAYGHGIVDNLREHPFTALQIPGFLGAQTLAIRRLLRSGSVDIVNSHWLIPQGLAAALLAGQNRSFGHVLSVHAADVYFLRRVRGGRPLTRFVLERTDHVFADGSHVAEALEEIAGREIDLEIRPMGTDPETFGGGTEAESDRPTEGDYLLYVGRFSEKKGVQYLIRAMQRVAARRPGLRLLLIGHGRLEDELRELTRSLNLADIVDFLGAKSHQEIGRYLRWSRLAVVPSVVDSRGETDGMPTVVLEAMSAGTRVVATAVDGIPDVVEHGVNGWLCPEKDPQALAETLLTALDDADPRIRQRSRNTAEQHSWSVVAESYRQVFEAVARGRAAR